VPRLHADSEYIEDRRETGADAHAAVPAAVARRCRPHGSDSRRGARDSTTRHRTRSRRSSDAVWALIPPRRWTSC